MIFSSASAIRIEILSLAILLIVSTMVNVNVYAESQELQDLLMAGLQSANNGLYEDAITYFQQILEKDPDNKTALNNIAAAYLSMRRYEDALIYTEKVLVIDPGNEVALSNRGVALFKLHRDDEALSSIDQALQIDPDNPGALTNKVAGISQIGRTEIQESELFGFAQVVARNSVGQLVAYTESKRISFLNHATLADKFLDSYPVREKVVIDGKNYDVIKLRTFMQATDDAFIASAQLIMKDQHVQVNVFDVLLNGFVTQKGDVIAALWTIYRPTS